MTKVIMTGSFRGGTGKSTLLSNLAVYLASLGWKVVIIDGDVISPGVHAIFGLDKATFDKTLSDYLAGHAKIEETVYDISKELHLLDGTLSIVPSSISYQDIADLLHKRSADKLITGIKRLSVELDPDYILVDTHPGLNEQTLLALEATDIMLNVVRPDNQDYQGLEVSAKVMKKFGVKTFVVLNKVPSRIRRGLEEDVEKTFGLPVAGALPFSDDLMLAQSQYVFSDENPRHEFSAEIRRIAEKVLGVKPAHHLEVMHDLLSQVKKPGITVERFCKTKNIPQKVCREYLDTFELEEYVRIVSRAGKDHLMLTERGEKFLAKYDVISKFVGEFRL